MIKVIKNDRSGAIYISMARPEKADENTFYNTCVENNLREVYVDKPVGVRDAFDVWRTEVRDATTPTMIEVVVVKDEVLWYVSYFEKQVTYRQIDLGWEAVICKMEKGVVNYSGGICGFNYSYEEYLSMFPAVRGA